MNNDELFRLAPWTTLEIFEALAISLKQDIDMPDYILQIASGTSEYEKRIRELWEEFKKNPTEANAKKLAEEMKKSSSEIWPEVIAVILGLVLFDLTDEQREFIDRSLEEHHQYIDKSLLPDILDMLHKGLDLSKLDHRVVFMYAGALWSVSYFASILYDGISLRNLADLFIFLGPNDEETCAGPRGCKQYANKIYTVAQILAQNIIPGQLRCLTNCRHMLFPIASPLKESEPT